MLYLVEVKLKKNVTIFSTVHYNTKRVLFQICIMVRILSKVKAYSQALHV
jgi:hypothetical protein